MAPRFWYQKFSLLAYLLSPVSLLFKVCAAGHHSLYRLGIKKASRFSVPIIIVGNLTVGGSGKTPFVIWLANWLKMQGFSPGIVSRGYGGHVPQLQIVAENSDPRIVGDEAILLRQKTGCPVVVAANRPQAVEKLLADFCCNIVISDDGLQHHALARDLEIVIIDGERKLGNHFCLPAGPLRESLRRLESVDFVINNGGPNEISADYFQMCLGDGYQMSCPQKKLNLASLAGQRVHAVAGIGHPQRFFQQLVNAGMQVIEHPFPDHYFYQPKDLNFGDDLFILMTEKDAVKCRYFVDERYWAVPVELAVSITLQKKIVDKMATWAMSAPSIF